MKIILIFYSVLSVTFSFPASDLDKRRTTSFESDLTLDHDIQKAAENIENASNVGSYLIIPEGESDENDVNLDLSRPTESELIELKKNITSAVFSFLQFLPGDRKVDVPVNGFPTESHVNIKTVKNIELAIENAFKNAMNITTDENIDDEGISQETYTKFKYNPTYNEAALNIVEPHSSDRQTKLAARELTVEPSKESTEGPFEEPTDNSTDVQIEEHTENTAEEQTESTIVTTNEATDEPYKEPKGPTEESTEKQPDVQIEVLSEVAAEEKTEPTVEATDEELEEKFDESAEEQTELILEAIDEQTEQPSNKPNEPIEESTEKLPDAYIEERAEEQTEPKVKATDDQIKKQSEEPAKEQTESTSEAIDESTEGPSKEQNESTEEPSTEPTDKQLEELSKEPAENQVETTVESTEELSKKSKEISTEKITDEKMKTLIEVTTKELTEVQTEEPTEKTTTNPAENLTDVSAEELTEEQTEKQSEEHTKELNDEPTIIEPINESTNESTTEPKEKQPDEPTVEITNETTDETTDETTENLTDDPTNKATEKLTKLREEERNPVVAIRNTSEPNPINGLNKIQVVEKNTDWILLNYFNERTEISDDEPSKENNEDGRETNIHNIDDETDSTEVNFNSSIINSDAYLEARAPLKYLLTSQEIEEERLNNDNNSKETAKFNIENYAKTDGELESTEDIPNEILQIPHQLKVNKKTQELDDSSELLTVDDKLTSNITTTFKGSSQLTDKLVKQGKLEEFEDSEEQQTTDNDKSMLIVDKFVVKSVKVLPMNAQMDKTKHERKFTDEIRDSVENQDMLNKGGVDNGFTDDNLESGQEDTVDSIGQRISNDTYMELNAVYNETNPDPLVEIQTKSAIPRDSVVDQSLLVLFNESSHFSILNQENQIRGSNELILTVSQTENPNLNVFNEQESIPISDIENPNFPQIGTVETEISTELTGIVINKLFTLESQEEVPIKTKKYGEEEEGKKDYEEKIQNDVDENTLDDDHENTEENALVKSEGGAMEKTTGTDNIDTGLIKTISDIMVNSTQGIFDKSSIPQNSTSERIDDQETAVTERAYTNSQQLNDESGHIRNASASDKVKNSTLVDMKLRTALVEIFRKALSSSNRKEDKDMTEVDSLNKSRGREHDNVNPINILINNETVEASKDSNTKSKSKTTNNRLRANNKLRISSTTAGNKIGRIHSQGKMPKPVRMHRGGDQDAPVGKLDYRSQGKTTTNPQQGSFRPPSSNQRHHDWREDTVFESLRVKDQEASRTSNEKNFIPILKHSRTRNANGDYSFMFESGDGIYRAESGKKLNGKNGSLSQEGEYSFSFPTGERFNVKYVADADGFQPESEFTPVAPPRVQKQRVKSKRQKLKRRTKLRQNKNKS